MTAASHRYREAAVARALGPTGRASPADRRAAFANAGVPEATRALVDVVARTAWKVTDAEIAAAKAAGATEDQLFELCVCAAMGQASRQLDAAMAALDAAAPPGDRADRADR